MPKGIPNTPEGWAARREAGRKGGKKGGKARGVAKGFAAPGVAHRISILAAAKRITEARERKLAAKALTTRDPFGTPKAS